MGSSKRLLQQSIRLLESLVQVKMKLLHLIPALAYVNAEVDLDGFLTNLLATFKYPTYGKQYVAAFSEYGCHCKKFSGATETLAESQSTPLTHSAETFSLEWSQRQRYFKNWMMENILMESYMISMNIVLLLQIPSALEMKQPIPSIWLTLISLTSLERNTVASLLQTYPTTVATAKSSQLPSTRTTLAELQSTPLTLYAETLSLQELHESY